jgi:polysaccharide biosynthesis transport protein
MSFNQFVSVLRARWKIALGVWLFIVLSTLVVSLLLPKKYTATASIVLDVKSPDFVIGGYVPALMNTSYMATQVDILVSDRVARRVVTMLRLSENQEIREQWQRETSGRGDFTAWLAKLLLDNLEVLPSKASNVLTISFRGVDAQFSALMANAFVQAYTDTTLELRVDPARQYSGFFDSRAKAYRDNFEKAQDRLAQFQKEKGLLVTDERLDIETARLAELSSQLVGLQALTAESSSRVAQARRSSDDMRDVLSDPLVTTLRADLSRQETQLQQMKSRLGDAHPQVIEMQSSINELRSRIAIETRKVTSSVSSSNNINAAREAQIKASLDEQRAKVLKMKELRDDAAILLKDVETAQRAYDTVLGRLNQTNLESQSTLTNVGVLSSAVEPPYPSFPKIPLFVAVAAVVGALLAMGVALMRELFDRRVRTVEDLTEQLQLPLLCVMPGPAAVRRFGRKVDPRLLMQQRVLGLPAASR